MKRVILICLCAGLLLSGCSTLLDGSYFWAAPHQAESSQDNDDNIQATNFQELVDALSNMAENGVEEGIIYVPQYDADKFETDMPKAVDATLTGNPIAAFAAEEITWELGSNSGQRAVSVSISYLHNRTEIKKIKYVADLDGAAQAIYTAMNNRETGLVLYLEQYQPADFAQLSETYAFYNPHYVMETPQITANIYPQWGDSRVVELKFAYQTPRDTLLSMQQQVDPIFSAAKLYVSGNAEAQQKFSQLYSFLMERYDYNLETSITPSYSLLCHGVGDSKAFSTVYAAMCREAGLDCQVISGTHQGQRWYWNLININGSYRHVDLLQSNSAGNFITYADEEMAGYVWDYSAYPIPTPPPVARQIPESPSTQGEIPDSSVSAHDADPADAE